MPSVQNSTTPAAARFEAITFHDPEAARANFAAISLQLSTVLTSALPALLAESPDPDSSLLYFDRFLGQAGSETLRLIERHPFLAHYAMAVFGHSRYLGETLIQNPDLLQIFLREKKLDQSYSREEFSESLARFRSRSFERDYSLLLARFKRREYVRILLRDVLKIAPLAETTAEISSLSDVLIEDALREAESALEHKYGQPQHLDSGGRALLTPFAVLSLGKLGGNELNYSSDIDLLYVHGDGREPASAPISNHEYFVRLAQHLTEILSRPTAEGPVFRIDLRLRPQGNEGELAISLSNAVRYYSEIAHDWEKQALIKVRCSAGNSHLARELIRRVQPQIYSEKINFAAIKTALVAREKIDRKRRRQLAAQGRQLDVKIDRGGIRDIEFLVQCLQRVYGGAEPWLRSGGTLFSVQKLYDKLHISGHDFHELTSAYTFLRHLEHRLQLRQGQQVHRLPATEYEREILRKSMEGLAPGEDRLTDLEAFTNAKMAAVGEIYRRVIFQQQAYQDVAPAEKEFQLHSLPVILGDQSQQQLIDRLSEGAPDLASAAKGGKLTSAGRKNLLRVLNSAYGSSERYAAVLRNREAIVLSLAIFEHSEYLTDILVRHPEELNTRAELQSPAPKLHGPGLFEFRPAGLEAASSADPVFNYIAASTAAHGEKVALLRRQFRHCMFASGARDLAEHRSVYESLAETNSAAENAISAAFGIAGAPTGLAICALGRLGSREFDLLSDADLIFICHESHDRVALTRSAEQIMQALSAYTQDGMVFPVDARLRPHGSEGELLVTPGQLENYFSEEAQAWEALTYTKMRFLVGNPELGRRAQQGAETLFRRFAAEDGFAAAVRQMRQRLQDASAPNESIRTSSGALYDSDFLSSFLLLKHGIHPKSGTLRDRLWRCSAANLLDKKHAALLDHAAELSRTVEHILRLVLGRNSRWLPSAEHPRYSIETLASRILRRDFPDGLEQELRRAFSQVREVYDRTVK
jgi:[glutamine synthetase] adenylyltransferase / [glutamine synthetase]-adenylyl-L-tyrosine phosphorylase